ncbi:hypothetical protein GCM10028793_05480 [Nocardiopsis oceani]
MTREALDGDDLEARSGDGHHQAAGNGETRTRREPPAPNNKPQPPRLPNRRTPANRHWPVCAPIRTPVYTPPPLG